MGAYTPVSFRNNTFDVATNFEWTAIKNREEEDEVVITDTNRDHLDSILRQGEFDYCLFAVEDGEITLAEERHV